MLTREDMKRIVRVLIFPTIAFICMGIYYVATEVLKFTPLTTPTAIPTITPQEPNLGFYINVSWDDIVVPFAFGSVVTDMVGSEEIPSLPFPYSDQPPLKIVVYRNGPPQGITYTVVTSVAFFPDPNQAVESEMHGLFTQLSWRDDGEKISFPIEVNGTMLQDRGKQYDIPGISNGIDVSQPQGCLTKETDAIQRGAGKYLKVMVFICNFSIPEIAPTPAGNAS
jgi:hypothetical protein